MKPTFKYFNAPVEIQPTRQILTIPAFVLSTPSWSGASSLLAEYPIDNQVPFSLRLPLALFGENFVVAIRWVVDTNVWARYKLFTDGREILNYPIYAGERIGTGAVLEIWSIDSVLQPALDEDYLLETSVLVYPPGQSSGTCAFCCTNSSDNITLTATEPTELPPGAACNPFCGNLCSTPTPMPTCECENKVVDNVQDGRDYEPVVFSSPALLFVLGGLIPGDGLGKSFYWDSASLAVDTGDETTTVIRPTSIGSLAPGRWLQYF